MVRLLDRARSQLEPTLPVLSRLRSGDWLTRRRLIAYSWISLAVYGVLMLVGLLTSTGSIDALHRPLGTDFSQVWVAGIAVLAGHAQQPFDFALHAAAQQRAFGPDLPLYGWHYPPYFLAVAALLALLPYLLALLVWQSITFATYLLVVWRILPNSLALLVASAFPATLINVGHGQNGFLTASLLGGGLVLLDRRPALAGILLGLLIYKPQFGLMLPFALVAGRRWTTIASAAGTVVLMTLATVALFGTISWQAFGTSLDFTRTVILEQGSTGWEKIQSVFSAARAVGLGVDAAFDIQTVLTGGVIVAVVWVWHGAADHRLKCAALIVATLLSTPYVLDYDMVLLGPAVAFAVSWELSRGVRPWTASLLTAIWVVPLLTRTVAKSTYMPLGLIAMLAFFAFTIMGARLSHLACRNGSLRSSALS